MWGGTLAWGQAETTRNSRPARPRNGEKPRLGQRRSKTSTFQALAVRTHTARRIKKTAVWFTPCSPSSHQKVDVCLPRGLTLQWGHDEVVVEEASRSTSCVARFEASMGPRRSRRGRAVVRMTTRSTMSASMGPRRSRRGRGASAGNCRCSTVSFNGATTKSSWKSPSRLSLRESSYRFNGATTKSSRFNRAKCHRGVIVFGFRPATPRRRASASRQENKKPSLTLRSPTPVRHHSGGNSELATNSSALGRRTGTRFSRPPPHILGPRVNDLGHAATMHRVSPDSTSHLEPGSPLDLGGPMHLVTPLGLADLFGKLLDRPEVGGCRAVRVMPALLPVL